MRITLIGFGSRGDVQPFVALAKGLQRAGHTVAVAAGTNFQAWIEGEGLGYEPIQVDIEQLMQTDMGKEWLNDSSSNPRRELQNMTRMADTIAEVVTDDLLRMVERADLLISGLLTVEAMETTARAYGKRHILGLLSPIAPTRSGAAGMQALIPRGDSILNRWWGYAIEAMLFTALRSASNAVRDRLKLPPATRGDFLRACNRTPALLGISPLVTPPPPDWDPHIHLTGYWFLDEPEGYQPPPALQAFLEAGPPPVYIGFGSMSNRDPRGTTRIMTDALQEAGQRGILHSGWAGLHAEDLPPEIYLLDSAPHSWLFPRMAAVIHHGGAGTTAAALRAGVPSAIVAHMGDQPYWGRRVHELGVGAAPIRRHHLTTERLTQMIRSLTGDPALRGRAAAFGERIRAEDGVGTAIRILTPYLDGPAMV
jgi:UDP:flavonoid glycosyltransferase YjiC (YdhE family)